jgi:hypothetical protein
MLLLRAESLILVNIFGNSRERNISVYVVSDTVHTTVAVVQLRLIYNVYDCLLTTIILLLSDYTINS